MHLMRMYTGLYYTKCINEIAGKVIYKSRAIKKIAVKMPIAIRWECILSTEPHWQNLIPKFLIKCEFALIIQSCITNLYYISITYRLQLPSASCLLLVPSFHLALWSAMHSWVSSSNFCILGSPLRLFHPNTVILSLKDTRLWLISIVGCIFNISVNSLPYFTLTLLYIPSVYQ